ncbi:putative tRNA pseudouridine synthase [Sesamum angolense]|uniref:tRNA pseudouridine synthase n=1 Tax=Sesamum angolense TaxID=2727404 RepID=A0AAE2C0E0_9LAMI|nr:putative tRNA pseudouridine synthase [Sesamum angolense]
MGTFSQEESVMRVLVCWFGLPRFVLYRLMFSVSFALVLCSGLQIQRDEHALSKRILEGAEAIEGELEKAIFKAGGIRDSNFGDLHKIGWARSSRTDKGVHSLATMISLKLEIPEFAWDNDPNGFALVSYVNSHLPENIRVFSILPSQRSFDAEGNVASANIPIFFPLKLLE